LDKEKVFFVDQVHTILNSYKSGLEQESGRVEEILQQAQIGTEELYDVVSRGMKSQRMLLKLSAYIPADYPVSRSDSSRIIFDMEKEGSIYHITMHSLLPNRMDLSEVGKQAVRELRTLLANDCVTSLNAYRANHCIEMFDEPCTVLFINYYNNKRKVRDNDNIDTKVFIDNVISAVFVPDDSPQLLSLIITSRLADVDHTEVFVGKTADVLQLMR
jgi:hypothetical protein